MSCAPQVLLLATFLAQDPAVPPASDPWVERLAPERLELDAGPEFARWSARLGRRFAVLDHARIAELRQRARHPDPEAPIDLSGLLGVLPGLEERNSFPCFVPLAEPGKPDTAEPQVLFVEVDPSGSFTTSGLERQQDHIADGVLKNVTDFHRDRDSRIVEKSRTEVAGVPSLRVLVETRLDDGRRLRTESWTVPGGSRCFTIWGWYDATRREAGEAAFRDLLAGFESAVEVPDPYGDVPKRKITLPIFVIFLLPFAILPLVLLRRSQTPRPPGFPGNPSSSPPEDGTVS